MPEKQKENAPAAAIVKETKGADAPKAAKKFDFVPALFAIAFIIVAALVLQRAAPMLVPAPTSPPLPATLTPMPETTLAPVRITPTPAPAATPTPKPRVQEISACGEITSAGTYYLNSSISLVGDNATCISIRTGGAKLDCNGSEISSQGTGNTGILISGANNSEVKNCKVKNFFQDLVLQNAHYSEITANNLSGFYSAIILEGSTQNTLSGNTASGFANGYGLRLARSSFNTISKNKFSENEIGAFFNSSDNNAFLNNTVLDNIFAGIWFYDSSNNTAKNNNFTVNPSLVSHRAGAIVQNGGNAFENNVVCTPAPYSFQCINGRAQDTGRNTCTNKGNGCNVACTPCPA